MKISTLIKFNENLDPLKPRLIRGSSGIGKSSVISQIAKNAKAKVIDLRLSELEPTDLVGLPYLADDGDEKVTRYAKPSWWPSDSDGLVYLILDELDRASEDMQPIAMQLCHERSAGGKTLPDNVVIWAACNGERYMTHDVDQALIFRFVVIDLTPSVEEWMLWAGINNINSSVIEYIKVHKHSLDTPNNLIGKPNIVCQNRRSWSDLGLYLNNFQISLSNVPNLQDYVKAFIGYSESLAFTTWLTKKYTPLDPSEFFKRSIKNIDTVQALYILKGINLKFKDKETTKHQRQKCINNLLSASSEVFMSWLSTMDKELGFILEGYPEVNDKILDLKARINN